jgi:hypothetical protein
MHKAHKAVIHCARPMLTTPLEPLQTSLLTPLGPSTGPPFGGASGRVLELIINSFYRSFPRDFV